MKTDIPSDIMRVARDYWWPHHASRSRGIALNELDGGSLGRVEL